MNRPSAFCVRISDDVVLGRDVQLHAFVNLYGCRIGEQTRLGTFVEVQKGAVIGARCKISSHTFICQGVVIEDEVFIGHGVTFTNDLFPRAAAEGRPQGEEDWECLPTYVRAGASIGSGTTLLCGIEIGPGAMIGAGSVVTRSIPAHSVAAGNPARVLRTSSTLSSR